MFRDQIGTAAPCTSSCGRSPTAAPESQQAIADRFSLTKGAVSRQVVVAERSDWLTIGPSPAFRREHVLTLTEAGRALVDRGRALQGDSEQIASAHLDPAGITATIRTLKIMCELMEREDKS